MPDPAARSRSTEARPGARIHEPESVEMIDGLIRLAGGDPESFDGRLVRQMVQTSLKLASEGHDTGQLKLINRSLKEMRYAYRVFNEYRGIRKVSIFGSARTPENHPDYVAAREFSRAIAAHGWMAITGAGDGIMKAGHEGSHPQGRFGLSIHLPFETTANEFIDGDSKLINFRYFFTRKLMFIGHSDAVTVLPGGFGTQDELFETLTLVQTGRAEMVPIVLLEGEGGTYWSSWEQHVREQLLGNGWIGREDPALYRIAGSIEEAVELVTGFYRRYHSSRYVRDRLVVRLKSPLSAEALEALNDEFGDLVESGRIESIEPRPEEREHRHLPRLAFVYTRRNFGRLRRLIDRINEGAGAD